MARNYQTYYYNSCIRKTIIAFGAVFNNIIIKRTQNGDITETLKVPISYASSQKYISRLQSRPEVNEIPFAMTLPRMSFQMKSLYYDTDRKLQPTRIYRSFTAGQRAQASFVPVPYNIDIELSILVKNQDDGLQIIEQILPQFHPSLNVTIQMTRDVNEEVDIPFVLKSIGYRDEFESDYTERSYIEWILNFTAKTYIFGPLTEAKDIRKTIVDYYTNIITDIPSSVTITDEVISTEDPPKNREDIDPKVDPYRIETIKYELFEDDTYFGLTGD